MVFTNSYCYEQKFHKIKLLLCTVLVELGEGLVFFFFFYRPLAYYFRWNERYGTCLFGIFKIRSSFSRKLLLYLLYATFALYDELH